MGRRGPKPLPTAALRLVGSSLATAERAAREAAGAPGAPIPPGWLSPEAREHWHRLLPLIPPGVATRSDGDGLGLIAEALAHYLAACEVARKAKPRGRQRALSARGQAWDRALRALREFGLTPSARVGLAKDALSENKDPLSAFASAKSG
jgi:phage terminase small subunit